MGRLAQRASVDGQDGRTVHKSTLLRTRQASSKDALSTSTKGISPYSPLSCGRHAYTARGIAPTDPDLMLASVCAPLASARSIEDRVLCQYLSHTGIWDAVRLTKGLLDEGAISLGYTTTYLPRKQHLIQEGGIRPTGQHLVALA